MKEVSVPMLVVLVVAAAFIGSFLAQIFYKAMETRIYRRRFAEIDQKLPFSLEERTKVESILRS